MSIELFDYSLLIECLNKSEDRYKGAELIAKAMPELLEQGFSKKRYGDLGRWEQALTGLPEIDGVKTDFTRDVVKLDSDSQLTDVLHAQLLSSLKSLIPWRKGPFQLFDTYIDTEWRSDFKWQRVAGVIEPLAGKRVLDVGCGSGYHCWRMAGEGAELVIGIDPTPLFVCQYWAVQKYAQADNVWAVPARLEQLPQKTQCFDTVFSMGVLYHRRSPFDHLQELKDALIEGGQLILETLVIDGGEGEVLVPEGRYSKMGNVWFLPSVDELCNWLVKMNFRDIEVVDVSVTSLEEQRSTEWMTFQSLVDFLDQGDHSKTVEGYPAPRRAVITARG